MWHPWRPTDWVQGLLREIVESSPTSLGVDCSERHCLAVLNQCSMSDMHRWGARGRVFESLRPDHIKSMRKPGSEATGFLCLQFTSLIALPTEVGCAGCSLPAR